MKATETVQVTSSQTCAPDATAAPQKKTKKIFWIFHLFVAYCIIKVSHKKDAQGATTTENPITAPSRKRKSFQWWRRFRNNKVAPAPDDQVLEKKEPKISEKKEIGGVKYERRKAPVVVQPVVTKPNVAHAPAETVNKNENKWLGFPNPAQICYMNSSLQSLLTLQDFIQDISRHEHIWRLVPEAAVIRALMDIKLNHDSSDPYLKINLLFEFKQSVRAPEFGDLQQEDAHEFLTCVLNKIRFLSPQLQMIAANIDKVYRCPVEDHLVFKMQNTRFCKRCGAGSTRDDVFTSLSLDMIPGGGTVEQMLQNYLMETYLEYHCECGAYTSGQHYSFVTLPRVLVLHIKRFNFTASFWTTKAHDRVSIPRELVMSSELSKVYYSLVSAISHIGIAANSGHYICDGMYLDGREQNLTDRWFTYNDAEMHWDASCAIMQAIRREFRGTTMKLCKKDKNGLPLPYWMLMSTIANTARTNRNAATQ